MAGHVGTKVRLRYLPHYDGQIEVFSTEERGRYLGSAYLAATVEQRRALSSVREKKACALKADLKAAEKLRRTRYTATTTPGAPRPRRTVTSGQAEAEIARATGVDLAARALPDWIPPREPRTPGPVRLPAPSRRLARRQTPGRQLLRAGRLGWPVYVTAAGSVE